MEKGKTAFVNHISSNLQKKKKKKKKKKKDFFGGHWYLKLFNLILFLGGAVTACMGTHFRYARYI
jgi:hypothetical protein